MMNSSRLRERRDGSEVPVVAQQGIGSAPGQDDGGLDVFAALDTFREVQDPVWAPGL